MSLSLPTLWSIPHRRPSSARRPLRSCRLSGESLESRQTPASLTLAGLLPDPNPQVGSGFGSAVVALPNGNVVVSAPFQDVGDVVDAGAVYLFNGETRKLLTTLTGAAAGDRVGSGGITALANGDYVVSSPHWDLGKVEDAGAVTWQSGKPPFGTPPVVPVSAANSLHGTSPYDWVGISSSYTFDQDYPYDGYGQNPQPPVFTFQLFDAVTPLPNGNYVVSSPWWNNGAAADAGAVTLLRGNGGMPAAGGMAGAAVGRVNSLYGSRTKDFVGSGYKDVISGLKSAGVTLIVTSPSAPIYVVASPSWTNPETTAGAPPQEIEDAGAVTRVDGSTGRVTGDVGAPEIGVTVSKLNSVYGGLPGALIGCGGVTPLAEGGRHTGNYVISSPMDFVHSDFFREGQTVDAGRGGAATWVDQWGRVWDTRTRRHGAAVNESNSLIGQVKPGADKGAPAVSTESMVSSGGVVALANGNYAVVSPECDFFVNSIDHTNNGAVTFGTGESGVRGTVHPENSLTGFGSGQSRVGSGGVTALGNGSYFVVSPVWNRVDSRGAISAAEIGAVTWVYIEGRISNNRGQFFRGGTINPDPTDPSTWNSLTGDSGISMVQGKNYPGDQVGSGGITKVRIGSTDYFAVASPRWDRPGMGKTPAIEQAGAVTLLDDTGRVVVVDAVKPSTIVATQRGVKVSVVNSLHGDGEGDAVGKGGIVPLAQGNFVVGSPSWRAGVAGTVATSSGGYGSGDDPTPLGAATWVGRLPNGTFRGIGSKSAAIVNESNSLVGVADRDQVSGGGVVALANGSYVVVSPDVDVDGSVDAGAVTWGSGSTGAVGRLLSGTGRSLTGSQAADKVGSGGVTPLVDGAYVVASPSWDNPSILGSEGSPVSNNDAGAVTRVAGDGLLSPTVATANAVVSIRNSLVGSAVGDRVGSGGVTALQGGNFLVRSDAWGVVPVNGVGTDLGAVTWVQGGAARGATVGSKNSVFGQVTEAGIVRDDARGRFLIGLREQTSNGRPNQRVVIGLQSAGFTVMAAAEPSLADQPTSMARAAADSSLATMFAALGAESATSAKLTSVVRAAKAAP